MMKIVMMTRRVKRKKRKHLLKREGEARTHLKALDLVRMMGLSKSHSRREEAPLMSQHQLKRRQQ